MAIRYIIGCDAVHPDRRGGQHVAMRCTGVLAIDDERGIGVLCMSERSQYANRVKAEGMLAALDMTELATLAHNLAVAGALYRSYELGEQRRIVPRARPHYCMLIRLSPKESLSER